MAHEYPYGLLNVAPDQMGIKGKSIQISNDAGNTLDLGSDGGLFTSGSMKQLGAICTFTTDGVTGSTDPLFPLELMDGLVGSTMPRVETVTTSTTLAVPIDAPLDFSGFNFSSYKNISFSLHAYIGLRISSDEDIVIVNDTQLLGEYKPVANSSRIITADRIKIATTTPAMYTYIWEQQCQSIPVEKAELDHMKLRVLPTVQRVKADGTLEVLSGLELNWQISFLVNVFGHK